MIKDIKVLFLTLFLLLFNSYSFAENKISFIDVNYIFANSDAGKKVNNQIKTKNKKINNEISNYQKKVKEEKTKLNNQKNVLSKEEFIKQAKALEVKVKEYNTTLSQNKSELNLFRNNIKKEFYIQLTKIVHEYAVKNSIEMILKKEDILIGKKNLDITKDILDLFNKEVKAIKIK